MGNQIFYCSACGTRILSSDFGTGRALRQGHLIRCEDCVRKAPPKGGSDKRPPLVRTDTGRFLV